MEADNEERLRRAEALFMGGHNCAQAVVAAFADKYGYTSEQALSLSAGFGGGMGRMCLTCGAACGMFILAGMENVSSDASDHAATARCYAAVRRLAGRFEAENGSLTCSVLLALGKKGTDGHDVSPDTAENCKKCPCLRQVLSAARLYAEYLEDKREE